MRIWKWVLSTVDVPAISMPKEARILDAQVQHGSLSIWALVDETAEPEYRYITVYPTGYPLPENPGEYISTFQQLGGDLVFHVFEVKM